MWAEFTVNYTAKSAHTWRSTAFSGADRLYGIDMGIRDPSGNHLRITEPKEFTP